MDWKIMEMNSLIADGAYGITSMSMFTYTFLKLIMLNKPKTHVVM